MAQQFIRSLQPVVTETQYLKAQDDIQKTKQLILLQIGEIEDKVAIIEKDLALQQVVINKVELLKSKLQLWNQQLEKLREQLVSLDSEVIPMFASLKIESPKIVRHPFNPTWTHHKMSGEGISVHNMTSYKLKYQHIQNVVYAPPFMHQNSFGALTELCRKCYIGELTDFSRRTNGDDPLFTCGLAVMNKYGKIACIMAQHTNSKDLNRFVTSVMIEFIKSQNFGESAHDYKLETGTSPDGKGRGVSWILGITGHASFDEPEYNHKEIQQQKRTARIKGKKRSVHHKYNLFFNTLKPAERAGYSGNLFSDLDSFNTHLTSHEYLPESVQHVPGLLIMDAMQDYVRGLGLVSYNRLRRLNAEMLNKMGVPLMRVPQSPSTPQPGNDLRRMILKYYPYFYDNEIAHMLSSNRNFSGHMKPNNDKKINLVQVLIDKWDTLTQKEEIPKDVEGEPPIELVTVVDEPEVIKQPEPMPMSPTSFIARQVEDGLDRAAIKARAFHKEALESFDQKKKETIQALHENADKIGEKIGKGAVSGAMQQIKDAVSEIISTVRTQVSEKIAALMETVKANKHILIFIAVIVIIAVAGWAFVKYAIPWWFPPKSEELEAEGHVDIKSIFDTICGKTAKNFVEDTGKAVRDNDFSFMKTIKDGNAVITFFERSEKLVVLATTYIKALLDWASTKITSEGKPFFKSSQDVADFQTHTKEMIKSLDTNNLQTIPDKKNFIQTYEKLVQYGQLLVKIDTALYTSVINTVFRFQSVFLKLKSDVASEHPRQRPTVIWFEGETRVGKTWSQEELPKAMFDLIEMRNGEAFAEIGSEYWNDSLVHTRKFENEFWEGYHSGHWVVKMDDIFQSADVSNRGLEALSVISIANDQAYPLHMAAMEAKASTFFVSKLLLMSSNLPEESMDNIGITKPKAFSKRRDFLIKVSQMAPKISENAYTAAAFDTMRFTVQKLSLADDTFSEPQVFEGLKGWMNLVNEITERYLEYYNISKKKTVKIDYHNLFDPDQWEQVDWQKQADLGNSQVKSSSTLNWRLPKKTWRTEKVEPIYIPPDDYPYTRAPDDLPENTCSSSTTTTTTEAKGHMKTDKEPKKLTSEERYAALQKSVQKGIDQMEALRVDQATFGVGVGLETLKILEEQKDEQAAEPEKVYEKQDRQTRSSSEEESSGEDQEEAPPPTFWNRMKKKLHHMKDYIVNNTQLIDAWDTYVYPVPYYTISKIPDLKPLKTTPVPGHPQINEDDFHYFKVLKGLGRVRDWDLAFSPTVGDDPVEFTESWAKTVELVFHIPKQKTFAQYDEIFDEIRRCDQEFRFFEDYPQWDFRGEQTTKHHCIKLMCRRASLGDVAIVQDGTKMNEQRERCVTLLDPYPDALIQDMTQKTFSKDLVQKVLRARYIPDHLLDDFSVLRTELANLNMPIRTTWALYYHLSPRPEPSKVPVTMKHIVGGTALVVTTFATIIACLTIYVALVWLLTVIVIGLVTFIARMFGRPKKAAKLNATGHSDEKYQVKLQQMWARKKPVIGHKQPDEESDPVNPEETTGHGGQALADLSKMLAYNTVLVKYTFTTGKGFFGWAFCTGTIWWFPRHFLLMGELKSMELSGTVFRPFEHMVIVGQAKNFVMHEFEDRDLVAVYIPGIQPYRQLRQHLRSRKDPKMKDVAGSARIEILPTDKTDAVYAVTSPGMIHHITDKEIGVNVPLGRIPSRDSYVMNGLISDEGKCSLPVMTTNSAQERKLLGINTAGTDDSSIIAPIYQEDVDLVQEKIQKLRSKSMEEAIGHIQIEYADPIPIPSCPMIERPEAGYYCGMPVFATIDKEEHTIQKTAYRPTPVRTGQMRDGIYFPPPYECRTMPAQLKPKGEIDPLKLSFRKEKGRRLLWGMDLFPSEFWKGIFTDYFKGFTYRTFSITEAINGIPSLGNFHGIKLSTCAGYPWSIHGFKRSDLIDRESDKPNVTDHKLGEPAPKIYPERKGEKGLWVHPELQTEIYTMFHNCKLKKVTPAYFIYAIKDELRDIERVKLGYSRGYAKGAVGHLIGSRMVFGSIISRLEKGVDHDVCLTSNPYSSDWTRMYNRLRQFGKNMISHDIEAWDINFPVQKYAPAWIYQLMIHLSLEFDGFEYHCFVNFTYNTLTGRFVIKKLIIIRVDMPSGSLATSSFNSKCNSVKFRRLWYEVSSEPFDDNVGVVVGGDDSVLSVIDDAKEKFNGLVIAKLAKEIFNHTHTSSTKKEVTLPFDEPGTTVFYKRPFKEEKGIVLSPLDPVTLEGMPQWVNKPKQGKSFEVQFKTNCHNALHEWALHPKEDFDKHKAILNSFLAPYGPDFLYTETWEDRRALIARCVSM